MIAASWMPTLHMRWTRLTLDLDSQARQELCGPSPAHRAGSVQTHTCTHTHVCTHSHAARGSSSQPETTLHSWGLCLFVLTTPTASLLGTSNRNQKPFLAGPGRQRGTEPRQGQESSRAGVGAARKGAVPWCPKMGWKEPTGAGGREPCGLVSSSAPEQGHPDAPKLRILSRFPES